MIHSPSSTARPTVKFRVLWTIQLTASQEHVEVHAEECKLSNIFCQCFLIIHAASVQFIRGFNAWYKILSYLCLWIGLIQNYLIQNTRQDFSPDTANETLALIFTYWCHFIYLKQTNRRSNLSLPLCDRKECTIHPDWMYFKYVCLSL